VKISTEFNLGDRYPYVVVFKITQWVEYGTYTQLRNSMTMWCSCMVSDYVQYGLDAPYRFYFVRECDMILFLLRWGCE
jgi:hypothetical protein